MKNLVSISSFLFCSLLQAQNYDKSAIESELKGYIKDPMSYHQAKSAQQYRVKELESIISELVAEKEKLNSDLSNAQKTIAEKAEASKQNASSNQGTDYRVQLAVSNRSPILSQFKNAEVRVANENGNTVYYISGFDSDDEAFDFSQSLRKLDTKGSFVTKYSDGSRDYSYSYTAPNKTTSYSGYGGKTNSTKSFNPYSSASKQIADPYKSKKPTEIIIDENGIMENTIITQDSMGQGAFQVNPATTIKSGSGVQRGRLQIED
jgi:hypothetical protein